MSEIRANTISDAAGTGPIALTGQSAAKAWCNASNVTNTISDSFNCASFVDLATGQCQINLSNNMSGTDYSVTSAHFHEDGVTYETSMSIRNSLTTSSCSWVTYRCTATTFFDSKVISFQACGDLA